MLSHENLEVIIIKRENLSIVMVFQQGKTFLEPINMWKEPQTLAMILQSILYRQLSDKRVQCIIAQVAKCLLCLASWVLRISYWENGFTFKGYLFGTFNTSFACSRAVLYDRALAIRSPHLYDHNFIFLLLLLDGPFFREGASPEGSLTLFLLFLTYMAVLWNVN